MNARKSLVAFLLLVWSLAPSNLQAGTQSPEDAKGFADNLRAIILTMLPTPIYENHKHWGQQRLVSTGVKWHGQGIHVYPEVVKEMKNDGVWWRATMNAPNIADTLKLDVKDLQHPEEGKMLFTVVLGFDTNVEYERQRWDAGVRLLSESARARLHVQLTIPCEWTTRFESNGTLLPDTILRLRVLSSDLQYDHLVVEHVAGLGGDAAKILGELTLKTVRQLHPSLERHLVEKLNASIVKAGDTKEVRISLKKLFGKPKKP